MSKKDKKILIAVDGNALLHRAWHALPPLTDRRGRVVNAVYGFLSTLFKVVKDVDPAYLAVTFDRPGKTFRHDAYGEYKATRVKQPDELYQQIPILEDALRILGVPTFGADGFEADDVLGTIAALAEKEKDIETLILTGDLDTLQLVSPQTKVLTLRKGITDTALYDEAAVRERYGLSPEQMVDYKALRGDPSDNIKGVPGVGEKTAAELLREFGTLEKLFSRLKRGQAGSLKETLVKKLLAGERDATLAKDLVTIRRDLKLDFVLRRAALHPVPRERAVELFAELGFKSLLARIPEAMAAGRGEQSANKIQVKKKIKKSGAAPWVITEPAEALAWVKRAGRELFILVGPGPSVALREDDETVFVHGSRAVRALKTLLEEPRVTKVTHDLKATDKILRAEGLALRGVIFDTVLADYLLAPGSRSHELAALTLEHLREELPAESAGQGTLLPQTPAEEAAGAARLLDVLKRLAPLLAKMLDERNQTHLLREFELPLAYVLSDMERLGVKIDPALLARLSAEFAGRIEKLSRAVWQDAGEEFNISSPQQLKTILFEKLRIPAERIKKTATGAGLSTAAAELEKLRGLHPIIEKIFEYRELTKLKSTYLDALPALLDEQTGRVHTSYNQTVTATGRLSSSDPNLQNIPIRTELGREIRRAFIADRGNVLVAADYSQLELRLVAVIAGVAAMINAFKRGDDIHGRTAAEMWNTPLEKVSKEQRRAAKAINFGLIYGMGAGSLAASAGVSLAEAKEFIRRYFEAYPQIRDYIELTKALAAKQGYAETVFGRRRYLPEITSGVPQVRAAAERMAINHPVQGTAADLLKLAMIRVHAALKEKDPAAKLILTVHDELVVECPEKDVGGVAALLKEEMENAHRFAVPMTVEIEFGKNWGEMKSL
ncbi:DNA polymerase I [Patescibacteria group bacterium]|nr:MAG: DNA polymerase I [Patescibacteria group bacterium]